MKKLIPYLTFSGKTEEAMKFYKEALGGELKMQTFREFGAPVAETEKNLIMHADLQNGELSIMASDGNAMHPVHMGDNVTLSLIGEKKDEEKLTEVFNKLAEDGKVEMKLEKQVWGDIYGQLEDKFGVHWSVNISSGQPQQG